MSTESVLTVSQRLNVSVEALAALGAELRLRQDGVPCNGGIRRQLQEVVSCIDPDMLDDADPKDEDVALAFIRAFFRQATDLLENPEREPGWTYEDPVVLQAMGQGSRRVVHAIRELAAQRPQLQRVLEHRGKLLDIGTGVGWLAIEAAQTWPALKVVGIDIWEPALALARKNLAGSAVEQQVEFRTQDLACLNDRAAYSVAWLAAPFISRAVIDGALERIARALQPGGWFIFGLYAPSPGQLGEALTALRIVRGGGHPWTTCEVEDRLSKLGFEQIETFSPGPPICMVVGRTRA
jgi:SAM-dependent methyltransferase